MFYVTEIIMCDKLEVDHLWFKLINVLDSAKE
jgi:hypothetical protein